MKKAHSPFFQPVPTGRRRRSSGITLVEILIVIVIIAVLAALTTTGVRRMKVAAAKTQTINQLRQISVGVNMWAAEKNSGEPMYAANGTADYGHESLPGPKPELAPGNPAKILFNMLSPDDSYLTDHTIFFSPLAKMKAPVRKDYKPDVTSPTAPWGTYGWYYPSTTAGELNPRQSNAMGQNWAVASISDAAKGKLLMANEYINSNPVWTKQYLALMVDGSVSLVAESEMAWKKWSGYP